MKNSKDQRPPQTRDTRAAAKADPGRPLPGAPKTLDRGYGDEHGGYIADPEAEHSETPERGTMPGGPDTDRSNTA